MADVVQRALRSIRGARESASSKRDREEMSSNESCGSSDTIISPSGSYAPRKLLAVDAEEPLNDAGKNCSNIERLLQQIAQQQVDFQNSTTKRFDKLSNMVASVTKEFKSLDGKGCFD